MARKDYEARHPLMYAGERVDRGGVVTLDEEEAAPSVASGTLRELPERKPRGGRPRKQAETEADNEE